MPDTLSLPKLRWSPSPNFSSRAGARVRLIVVHDCEGSYLGSIDWFRTPKSQVSAHYVLREDGAEATQMVDTANKAWHAVAFNGVSIGLEMAGFSAKGFGAPEWGTAAAIVAYLLHANGLPPTWAQHGAGMGFCSHYDLGQAGGGHKDPTTNSAVWDGFAKLVEAAYALQPPAVWTAFAQALPPAPSSPLTRPTDTRHDLPTGSVAWAQMRLNALGFKPPLGIDGIMGNYTAGALGHFQSTKSLPMTHQLDARTIAALT